MVDSFVSLMNAMFIVSSHVCHFSLQTAITVGHQFSYQTLQQPRNVYIFMATRTVFKWLLENQKQRNGYFHETQTTWWTTRTRSDYTHLVKEYAVSKTSLTANWNSTPRNHPAGGGGGEVDVGMWPLCAIHVLKKLQNPHTLLRSSQIRVKKRKTLGNHV